MQYVTTAQAADRLGVAPETVRAYARRGLLDVAMRLPNGFMFKARDVDRLAARLAKGNGR